MKPRAAYIHIPFCAHHCGYCDFAVVEGQNQFMDGYLDALEREMALLQIPQVVETVFIGGGTPTELDTSRLERLLDMVNRWLPRNANPEVTVEANPESLDEIKIALMAEKGVTRVSLGAQSYQSHLLKVLERRHDPEVVEKIVRSLQQKIPRISLDLIFGIPGQTVEDWRIDLTRAIESGVNHISTYGLTFEKGTLLWKQRRDGTLRSMNEEEELVLYRTAIEILEENAFEHYEISSFARSGDRCRHNETYWANESYYGFGMGAARYVEGKREINSRSLQTYMQKVLAGEDAAYQSETLDARERARETMAIQLRRKEGIDRQLFLLQTGWDLDSLADKPIADHAALGLVEDDGVHVRLSRKGKFVADSVIQNLL